MLYLLGDKNKVPVFKLGYIYISWYLLDVNFTWEKVICSIKKCKAGNALSFDCISLLFFDVIEKYYYLKRFVEYQNVYQYVFLSRFEIDVFYIRIRVCEKACCISGFECGWIVKMLWLMWSLKLVGFTWK